MWDSYQVCPPLASGSKPLFSLTSLFSGFSIPSLQTYPINMLMLLFQPLGYYAWGWTPEPGHHIGSFWTFQPCYGGPLTTKGAITSCNQRCTNQRFHPLKYFDSLAMYLSSNLYVSIFLKRISKEWKKWVWRQKLFLSGQLARVVYYRLILPLGNFRAPSSPCP